MIRPHSVAGTSDAHAVRARTARPVHLRAHGLALQASTPVSAKVRRTQTSLSRKSNHFGADDFSELRDGARLLLERASSMPKSTEQSSHPMLDGKKHAETIAACGTSFRDACRP
jgi:hypothetical protein